ncbi:MAG: 30S ribosomal protein S14 [Planctomycetota bacterium]
MAKTSQIQKNQTRRRTVAKYAERRKALKAILQSSKSSDEEKDDARARLAALPRDSNPNRVRNRCLLTGRPRANYRKFGISRIAFRELSLLGEIPGVRKASW